MFANRVQRMWFPLWASLSALAAEVYQGITLEAEDGADETTAMVLVLERENGFTGGWLKIGDSRVARVYGDSDSALNLLWGEGGRAHLQLVRQGDDLYEKRSFREGLNLAREFRNFARTHFGQNHPFTLTSTNNLAALYQEMGSNDKALSLFLNNLERREQVLGESHPDTLVSRLILASLYKNMGNYNKAFSLHLTTLEKQEQVLGESHPHSVQSQSTLATLYEAMGNYDKTLPLFIDTLKQNQRLLGETHSTTLSSRNDLARLYQAMGSYDKALPLILATLELSERVLGKTHLNTLSSQKILASLYKSMGNYQKALPLYLATLVESKRVLGESHSNTLAVRIDLAALYQEMGSYEKALSLLLATLALSERELGKTHPNTLISRNNLTELYQEIGSYDKALSLCLVTLGKCERVLGETHPTTLSSRNALAHLYQAMGSYDKALPLFLDTLKQYQRLLGETHPNTLRIRNNLGFLYGSRGRFKLALPLFRTNLEECERFLGKTHPHTLVARTNLAVALALAGHTEEALDHFHANIRQTNIFLERISWGLSEPYRQYLLSRETKRSLYLSLLVDHGGITAGEEILYISLTRDGILRRIAIASNKLARASRAPKLQKLVEQLRLKRAQFSALSLKIPKDTNLKSYKHRLHQIEDETESLENQMAVHIGKLRPDRILDVNRIRQSLGANSALVSFLAFQKVTFKKSGIEDNGKYLIAVIVNFHGEKPYHLIKLGPLDPIGEDILAWRHAVPRRWGRHEIGDLGRALYDKLWQPLTPYLNGIERVYVVADGPLQLLPMGALPGPDNLPLGSGIDLVFMDAVYDLLAPSESVAGGAPLICYAPNYGTNGKPTLQTNGPTQGALSFTALPGAKGEGERITDMFREAGYNPRALTGEAASETALSEIRASETPRLLHIASHGFFHDTLPTPEGMGSRGGPLDALIRNHWTLADQNGITLPTIKPSNPLLRSGIALAGANRYAEHYGEDDGLLTALEAEGLALDGTRLVVLSACETGLGELREGEGVYGLRRAFFLAGARALLTTLWRVDDAATRRFMERFYELYLTCSSPRKALRQVQGEFQARENDNHPVYWAPFHLIEIPETPQEQRP